MRKILGAGIAGLVIVGSAAIGTGTAAAEPLPAASRAAADCSRALLPLLTGTQKRLCEAALGLTGSVGSTAGSVVPSAPRAVPRVVPRVVPRTVPRVVPRVVEGVGETVAGATGSGRSAPATRTPRASSSSGGTSGTSGSGAATRAPAGGAVAAATPIAPTQDYDTLMSSAYDRVPTGLLGTSPVGGAGASLIAPTALDPRQLLSGRPSRTLGGPENGVTTASTADPTTIYSGGRIGTPALLGVLTASSVLALFVRSVVLRRSRRPARA